MNEAIGERIRDLCRERDMTVVELANATRLPVAEVNAYAAGRARPCPTRMRRLARALGVTTDALLRVEAL
ncbi:MAG: helix-turn-helix transcriptional regulator [Patulibacter sp.]|nr:helix-turn-helix transcriptional regulator [Patulibacter sp.]